MKSIATGIAHNTNDFLARSEPGSFIRASGDCVCTHCGREYQKHPHDPYELSSIDSHPFLRVLCDGRRVKL